MIWLGLFLGFSMTVDVAKAQSYRLPGDLVPISYKLDIVTNFKDFTFLGDVTIKINCIKSTKKVVLHSTGLKVTGTPSLAGPELSCNDCLTQSEDIKNDFLIFTLQEKLKAGSEYTLNIPFKGELKPTLAGYYRSRYTDRATNETKYLGVTQFEPSSARLAFPCFDEPEMKAKFTIRLGHKTKYTGVSNMPLAKTTPMDKEGWVWDEFEESVPMSTYLVAWMVSEFKYGEAPLRPNGVKFRIWARPDALDQIKYALHAGPKILKTFVKYFKIKYVLPKMDLIAIPDFESGAMENWGMVTFRETQLLYDKKRPSIHSKEQVAYVIAHELAHQWFGNLVTMKWWTDLWLNEGFATYVGTLGVEKVHPEFNYMNEASMNYFVSVLSLDGLKSSHPISVKVGPPSEVSQIFDTISYRKGATVIRMMHHFLGNSFKKGVTNYLKAHKFGNAEQDDLWMSLTEQAHKDGVLPNSMTVKEVMDSWTLQTGYPILKVVRSYEDGTATIEQYRYLSTGHDENDKTCWWFPLTYTTGSEQKFDNLLPKQWLKCGEGQVEIRDVDVQENDWLIVNLQLTGLARVLYDPQNYDLIIKTLNSKEYNTINELNRAGLILDAFEFAERGDLSYETALRLVNYISRETSYIPLARGLSALGKIEGILSRTPNFGIFKAYMKKILQPLYDNLVQNNGLFELPEDVQQQKIHLTLVKRFCTYGVGECKTQALELFNEWSEAENNSRRHEKHQTGKKHKHGSQVHKSRRHKKHQTGKKHKGGLQVFESEENPTKKFHSQRSSELIVSGGSHHSRRRPKKKTPKRRKPHKKSPHKKSPKIPFDLLPTVLCTAVKHGDESTWQQVYQRYRASNLATEKSSLLGVLACSREVWVLNRYLEWTLTEDHGIRRQDSLSVISTVAANNVGFYLTFDFLESNMKRIYDYHYPRVSKLGRLINSLAHKIIYQHELHRLQKLVETNAKYLESAKMAVQQSLEKAAINVKWHNTHYEKISSLLAH